MTRHAWIVLGALALACGGRPDAWNERFSDDGSGANALGLTGSVAVVDSGLQRVTLLSAPSALDLRARSFPLGRALSAAQTSLDRKTLFLLTRGVYPQRSSSDEPAQLTLLDGGTQPSVLERYTLRSPMDALVLDPQNEWGVVYGGSGVVVNLNELVLVNLAEHGAAALTEKTLRSFGGDPRRFTFTPPLAVPGADARRFLIVERDHDLVLIDLSHPDSSDITVPLPSADNGSSSSSAQVVYDSASATIAVRVTGTSSVLVLQLAEPTDADSEFSVVTNLVDVGGQPATIDFVHNTQGLRLVALVGTNAVLVDPVTATTQSVTMPAAFTGIRRITDELNPAALPADGDVALLYGPSITKIAYFTLGGAPGALYRSIDAYDIGVAVRSVIDVPGERYFDHKILETPSQQFYVLDLSSRQSAPMKTNDGLTLEVAPDGQRVWAYKPGSSEFASVDFETLHPISLIAERPLSRVFDIEATDGTRSAFALHLGSSTGIAATVLDALAPSTANARFYSGIELGGIR